MPEQPLMPEGDFIQFVGLHDLAPLDQQLVRKICRQTCEKLMRKAPVQGLKVHIKSYQNEGAQRKYSIHLSCSADGRVFECDMAHDFDLARAMHKAFDNLKNKVDRTLHTDISTHRPHSVRPPQHNQPSKRV